jgi:hypothetical protein
MSRQQRAIRSFADDAEVEAQIENTPIILTEDSQAGFGLE